MNIWFISKNIILNAMLIELVKYFILDFTYIDIKWIESILILPNYQYGKIFSSKIFMNFIKQGS